MQRLPDAVADAIKSRPPEKKQLVDTRGLCKPRHFSNKEEDFVVWARKLENYVCGVFDKAGGILTLAAEAQEKINTEEIAAEAADISADDSIELDRQLYSCLMALTDGEAIDIDLCA